MFPLQIICLNGINCIILATVFLRPAKTHLNFKTRYYNGHVATGMLYPHRHLVWKYLE